MKKIDIRYIKIGIFLIVLSIITLFATPFVLDNVLHDGHMHFPLKPSGSFEEQPHVVDKDGQPQITWVLARGCSARHYQVVTDDYIEDEQPTLWFGSGKSECATREDGYIECTAQLEDEVHTLLENGFNLWFVVKGLCEGSTDTLISEKLIIKG